MSSRISSSSLKAGLRAAGLAALALAGGALCVQAVRVRCKFVSAGRTRIQYQNGYADALVDIAETICNEATGQPIVVPIEERISAVAFAQAEAVASVIGTCAGDGSATLQVRARRRAEAQAQAVGVASASIIAASGVCDVCEATLEAYATAVETLTARAVAQVDLDATVQFNGQPLTVSAVQTTLATEIRSVLSTVTGEIRASAVDGCDIVVEIGSRVGDGETAACDVAVSANDILTQIDAVADAGLEVQGFGCDGVDSFLEVELKLREVATAVAQAITQATAFCETSGGPGTMACGVSRGTVNAVASAQATAFATAIAEAYGPECDCDVFGRLDAEEMTTVIAEASASALAEVCVSGVDYARAFDFQNRAEERVAEAIAEAFAGAYVGTVDCGVALGLVAETNPVPSGWF